MDADIETILALLGDQAAVSDLSAHSNDPNAHHNWPLTVDDIPAGIPRDADLAASISAHAGLADAHHNWPLTIDDIPDGIARDGDIDTAVAAAVDAHAGLADAHHNWPLLDGDIPASIARDSEVVTTVNASISAHATDVDAHHNWPLLDGDIPASIARDVEVVASISAHAADADAHHNWPLTFADIPSSASPGAAQAVLATDAGGLLTLHRLAVGGFAGNLLPDAPDSRDIGAAANLWRKAWLSELDAVRFVENTASVLGGWFIIPKASFALYSDVDTTTTGLFAEGDLTGIVSVNDTLLLRANGQVEYMQVTYAYYNGTVTIFIVTRNLDGSGANSWAAGTPVLLLGSTGDGRIELDAQSAGPRISVLEQGAAYNAQSERVRLGDMAGWKAGVSGYGIGLGDPSGNHLYYTPGSGLVIAADGGGMTNINGGNIQTNTITATQIAAGTITADRMNVSQLSAITADLGSITAGTITGGTIRTAASGPRVEMNSAELRLITGKFMRFEENDVLRGELGPTNDGSVRLLGSGSIGANLNGSPTLASVSGWTIAEFTTAVTTYSGKACRSFYWSEAPLVQFVLRSPYYSIGGSVARIQFSIAGSVPWSSVSAYWNNGALAFSQSVPNTSSWRTFEFFSEKPAGASSIRLQISADSTTPYTSGTFYLTDFEANSLSGVSYLDLNSGSLDLYASGNVNVTGDTIALGGNVSVTGDTALNGNVTTTGTLTGPSSLLTVNGDVYATSGLRAADGAVIGSGSVGDTAGEVRIYSGSTLVGQLGNNGSTDYLRINQDVAKDIYTPRTVRADGGFQTTGGYEKYASSAWHTGYLFTPYSTFKSNTGWDGDAKSTSGYVKLDLSALFGVPAGVKAVLVRIAIRSATAGAYLSLGPGSSKEPLVARVQTANQYVDASGIVPCDANGDIYYMVGNASLTNAYIRIWGYWI